MSEAVTLALRTHTCAQAFAGCVGASLHSLGRFRTVTYRYYACYELIYHHYTHHGRGADRGSRSGLQ